MTRTDFWAGHAQGDLFPNRTTVSREFAAELVITPAIPNMSESLTEAGHRPNGIGNYCRQDSLPWVRR